MGRRALRLARPVRLSGTGGRGVLLRAHVLLARATQVGRDHEFEREAGRKTGRLRSGTAPPAGLPAHDRSLRRYVHRQLAHLHLDAFLLVRALRIESRRGRIPGRLLHPSGEFRRNHGGRMAGGSLEPHESARTHSHASRRTSRRGPVLVSSRLDDDALDLDRGSHLLRDRPWLLRLQRHARALPVRASLSSAPPATESSISPDAWPAGLRPPSPDFSSPRSASMGPSAWPPSWCLPAACCSQDYAVAPRWRKSLNAPQNRSQVSYTAPVGVNWLPQEIRSCVGSV